VIITYQFGLLKGNNMRTQTIPEQVVNEDIISFEHIVNSYVRFLVGKGEIVDGKFQPFPSQTYDSFVICDTPGLTAADGTVIREDRFDYTELMSANPSWAPHKPAGVFRQDDLWHFVDLIRSRP
jgi:hypothetical protein